MSEEAPACRSDPGTMPRAMTYIKDVQVGSIVPFCAFERCSETCFSTPFCDVKCRFDGTLLMSGFPEVTPSRTG
jgi:hypothetical protein